MKAYLTRLLAALVLSATVNAAFAQGTTAFTYQGQLRDNGTNANGAYTMIFKLYDAASGGNQIGGAITNNPTLLNGLFTVTLDFGAGAFDGNARWLDITLTNGPDTQELSPRVQVLPSPYAQFAAIAATVTNGAIMNPELAINAIATTNIQNNAVTTAQIADEAVTNRNIASNSITSDKLAFDSEGLARVTGGFASVTNNGSGPFIAANGDIIVSGNISAVGDISAANFPGGAVPNGMKEFASAGTYSFVVPTNISRLMVELWGAGGGGGAGNITGGGGGGGGAYSQGMIDVTPRTTLTVTVGAGGIGDVYTGLPDSPEYGGDGGSSSIASNNEILLIVSGGGKGGYFGGGTGTPPAGIGGAGGVPDANAAITRAGTVGGAGQYESGGGGGGGSGGYTTFCPLKVFVSYSGQTYGPPYYELDFSQSPGCGGNGGGQGGGNDGFDGQDGYVLIRW